MANDATFCGLCGSQKRERCTDCGARSKMPSLALWWVGWASVFALAGLGYAAGYQEGWVAGDAGDKVGPWQLVGLVGAGLVIVAALAVLMSWYMEAMGRLDRNRRRAFLENARRQVRAELEAAGWAPAHLAGAGAAGPGAAGAGAGAPAAVTALGMVVRAFNGPDE